MSREKQTNLAVCDFGGCGKKFVLTKHNRKYCSPRCRQAAWVERTFIRKPKEEKA